MERPRPLLRQPRRLPLLGVPAALIALSALVVACSPNFCATFGN
jgi:hypothetical protein